VTDPATGRPLRQLLGDELPPNVAGALRLYLIGRELWNSDLDLLDQMIPTAETMALLIAADRERPAPEPSPSTTDTNGRRHTPLRRTR
jgi:hypothetical protein